MRRRFARLCTQKNAPHSHPSATPIAFTLDETRKTGRRRTSSATDSSLPDKGSSCLRNDRCGNGRGSLWLWFAVDIFRIGLAQSRKPSWVVVVGTDETGCSRLPFVPFVHVPNGLPRVALPNIVAVPLAPEAWSVVLAPIACTGES